MLRPCNKSCGKGVDSGQKFWPERRLSNQYAWGMYPRISQGRRLLGITIDWLAAYAVTLGFFAGSGSFLERSRNVGLTVLLVLTVEYLVLVALTGASFGHRIVGLKVVRFSDGGPVTILQALIRTLLLVTVVTAVTFDENGRAPNERFSNTVLVKR